MRSFCRKALESARRPSIEQTRAEDGVTEADMPAESGTSVKDEVAATAAAPVGSLATPYSMLNPRDRNPNFVGRHEVFKLIDKVLLPKGDSSPRQAQIYVVSGFGGIGKSDLAREYAFSRQQNFDAVFWMNEGHLNQSFAKIAVQLGYSSSLHSPQVNKNRVLRWLENPIKQTSHGNDSKRCPTASWLLVLDDASLGNRIPPFIFSQNGSVLITSRHLPIEFMVHPDWAAAEVDSILDLEPLQFEDAARLLRLLAEDSDYETSMALSKRLRGFPLAITQLAAFLKSKNMTIQKFLKYYDQDTNSEAMPGIRSTVLQKYYKEWLYPTWALENRSPGCQELLRALSFLDSDAIYSNFRHDYTNKHVRQASRMQRPTYISRFYYTLKEANDYALVRGDEYTLKTKILRVVQDAVRSQMSRDEIACSLESAAQMVYMACPYRPYRSCHSTGEIFDKDLQKATLPHILKLHYFYKKYRAKAFTRENISVFKEGRTVLAELFYLAGWHLIKNNQLETAETMLRTVLELSDEKDLKFNWKRGDIVFALCALSTGKKEDIDECVDLIEEAAKTCIQRNTVWEPLKSLR